MKKIKNFGRNNIVTEVTEIRNFQPWWGYGGGSRKVPPPCFPIPIRWWWWWTLKRRICQPDNHLPNSIIVFLWCSDRFLPGRAGGLECSPGWSWSWRRRASYHSVEFSHIIYFVS
jgi:hypothetical protein